jgi:putative nucleotidyltransferase with HDIG domain
MPDLVLMDITLDGGMDGIEAAGHIRARFNIPVIYLTAYVDDNLIERAKITEPFGYMIKPFQKRELHSTIAMALYKHKSEIELLEGLEKMVDALGYAFEMRDPYTGGHQRRVSKLAEAIAREMGCSHDEIRGIRLASLVHDIGKIQVPSEILSKPGKLTDNEFAIIKTHPQAGYDILKRIQFPWPIADMIYQHHEKLDGSGYPRGLKGDEIIFQAKIMAVADTVEATSSHRPYRPALGVDKALEHISENRGILYDPKVVDICLKLFKEEKFKFEEQDRSFFLP